VLRTLAHGQKPHCWFWTLGRLSATFPSVDTSRCVLSLHFATLPATRFPPTGDSVRLKPWRLLAARPRTSCPNRDSNVVSFLFASNQKFHLYKRTISQHTTGRFESKPVHLTRPSNSARNPAPFDRCTSSFQFHSSLFGRPEAARLTSRASGSADSMAGSWFKFPPIARSSAHLIFTLLLNQPKPSAINRNIFAVYI
jgi:hypothetical protein